MGKQFWKYDLQFIFSNHIEYYSTFNEQLIFLLQ
jgi:hypothetical protein